MKIELQTSRLLLREMVMADAQDLFEMDSDPEVHRYLGNTPVTDIAQIHAVINMLQAQYLKYGIARWAVLDKRSGECIGWSGLKYLEGPINGLKCVYDLGYRFKQKHWGKGYATEAGEAVLGYGFREMGLAQIYSMTEASNAGSQHVLHKLGFQFQNDFVHEGFDLKWFACQSMEFDSGSQRQA
jgi:[ribosomal protein S5]-alanine N-acetyltransferase